MFRLFAVFVLLAVVQCEQIYSGMEPSLQDLWGQEWPFMGIPTFAHLNHTNCLLEPDVQFDIGIIGVPFDTATTYRSGARFGPRAIRLASQRQNPLRAYNSRSHSNPYNGNAVVLDCGDIPVTPMDNALALKQMTMAFEELLLKRISPNSFPRLVALGGDHSVLLPHLRALSKAHGKVAVVHFDAHLDTWLPSKYPSFWHSDQSAFTHGSMLWMAWEEGLLSENNVHVGLRTRLSGEDDYADDDMQDFIRVEADEIWREGLDRAVDRIKERIPKGMPVYISVDIDVLDPGFAPGTGTIEPGGLLPRELIFFLRQLEGLNIVGADVVETNPAFDHAEITATNAAQAVFELITSMEKRI